MTAMTTRVKYDYQGLNEWNLVKWNNRGWERQDPEEGMEGGGELNKKERTYSLFHRGLCLCAPLRSGRERTYKLGMRAEVVGCCNRFH